MTKRSWLCRWFGINCPRERPTPPARVLILRPDGSTYYEGADASSRIGTPSWPGTLHYESESPPAPGIRFDLHYTASVPVTNPATVHTLQSITVTRDAASPYTRMVIRHPDGSQWTSPVIPAGTMTFTKGQINAQGFTVLEDCAAFTAEP